MSVQYTPARVKIVVRKIGTSLIFCERKKILAFLPNKIFFHDKFSESIDLCAIPSVHSPTSSYGLLYKVVSGT